jgi:hypothetical protein
LHEAAHEEHANVIRNRKRARNGTDADDDDTTDVKRDDGKTPTAAATTTASSLTGSDKLGRSGIGEDAVDPFLRTEVLLLSPIHV